MNFYEINHKCVLKSGEVKIYKYKVKYTPRIKKYDGIRETYKDTIKDNTLTNKQKINRIYEHEKNNFTLNQIKNFIYRSSKNEECKSTRHKTYDPLIEKYNNIINDKTMKKSTKIKLIYELEQKNNSNYTYNSIKNFIYKHQD